MSGKGRKKAVPEVEYVAPLRVKPLLFQETFIGNYFGLHLLK
jgi:hypothetical protein